ncbi:GNAT family N-acetyltransferase [Streptomyces corynorhini]|uniref:GNAT family N-acetyltransferase n=1 Tax=Streptomyces corynorhini TaxID=2282652 RepID=A0A370BEK0_9ACTN|nr:GNAT family N-acetyltransferase [Streptomyces corynorhini]RDG37865.1 GNAT family N-acetyltransferase [Streptomyces corynorhini]
MASPTRAGTGRALRAPVSSVPVSALLTASRSPSPPVFTTEVCTDTARFAAIAPEWNALYRASRTATPFQSHAWLYSWWLSYGTGGRARARGRGRARGLTHGRLRVVLVRRRGELVAAAALMRSHRPVPVLVPLGGTISDFSDVLLDESRTGEEVAACADALTDALAELARTAVIDLREVRPGAAAEQVHARWKGPQRRLADSICLELPAVPMDGLLARLPASRAQRFRAKLRKLDALGVEERAVPADEVPAAVCRMLELHRRQWEGRGVTPEHLSARFAEHLTRSARSMVASGDARLTEFRLAGAVVAADLTLMSGGLAGGYLYGADPALRARKVDVATMLLRGGAGESGGSGRATLSMLRGNEPYKHHWRPETVRNQRLLLAGPALAPSLWLLLARAAGRERAAALVKRLRGTEGGDKR